jgi:hypothetical protein
MLAATRRRLGETLTPGAAGAEAAKEEQVVELADDRPPPAPTAPPPSAGGRYKGDWPKAPSGADLDRWVADAVGSAVEKVFDARFHKPRRGTKGHIPLVRRPPEA